MLKYIVIFLIILAKLSSNQNSSCTKKQIVNMIMSDLSQSEIDQRCGLQQLTTNSVIKPEKREILLLNPSISSYSAVSRELVYTANGKKLSELFWKTNYANLLGLKATLIVRDRVYLGASIKSSIGGEAQMDDYDWLCGEGSYSCTSNDWSHHSYSPNTTVEDIRLLRIFLKYKSVDKIFKLFLVGGLRYDYFKWIASNRGTEYVYTNRGSGFRDNISTSYEDTPAITYEQTFTAPYVGVEIGKDFKKSSIGLKLEVSPFVTAEDKDIHHNRNLVYYDKFSTVGNMLDLELSFDAEISNRLSLNLRYNYFKYFENSSGYSEYYENGKYIGRTADGTAGIDNESSMVELGFSLKI
jgi:plasminogen activator